MFARRLLVSLAVTATIALTPALAVASWTTAGGGSVVAAVGSIASPSGGSASNPTSSSLTITWTTPTAGSIQGEALYTVNKTAGSGCVDIAASAGMCQIFGLAGGATYTFTIQAGLGTKWISPASTSFTGTTTSSAPATPTSLSIHIDGSNKITPTWAVVAGLTYQCQTTTPQGTAPSEGSWLTCTSGIQMNGQNGARTFYLRAVNASNQSSGNASSNFTG